MNLQVEYQQHTSQAVTRVTMATTQDSLPSVRRQQSNKVCITNGC